MFFFLPLCSGQWAHAMFIRLKVSHCDERKGEKMQNTKEKPIAGTGSAFSAGLFLLQIETKSLWKAPERGGIDLSVI